MASRSDSEMLLRWVRCPVSHLASSPPASEGSVLPSSKGIERPLSMTRTWNQRNPFILDSVPPSE